MRDDQRERLRILADSINDSARMGRATLSLFLLVALYLSLTLFSSTDENLFRNGQVVLPQIGAGITVVQSYIFGPLVFLFLHGQALFILSVTARKVRAYETALRDEFPGTTNAQRATRRECRDWLSAFALVQVFQKDPGVSNVARVLIWTATDAIPLALLFVITLSFVRYQSNEITATHHVIFVLDLLLVIWFNHQVFSQRLKTSLFRTAAIAKGSYALGRRWMLIIFTPPVSRTPNNADTPDRDQPSAKIKHYRQSIRERFHNILGWLRTLPKNVPAALAWTGTIVKWTSATCMLATLLLFAHPPRDTDDRSSIWYDDNPEPDEYPFVQAIFDFDNLLDAGPCKWWTMACRYLDVQHFGARTSQTHDADIRRLRQPDVEGLERDQPARVKELDFAKRTLRFAKLAHARLQDADFRKAELHGADLQGAHLQNADLRHAKLTHAMLGNAHLQGANLFDALLTEARLHGARLQGANLQNAQLQGADLTGARLSGADLFDAGLQGTNLSKAQLQGAYLRDARLQGATLTGARFQGANLRNAELQAADFTDTWLEGTNLAGAKLACSFGRPREWKLAWMHAASYDFGNSEHGKARALSADAISPACLVELIGGVESSIPISDLMAIPVAGVSDTTLSDYVTSRIFNCQTNAFSWKLPDMEDMVFAPFKYWDTVDTGSPEYRDSLTKWTVDFACMDKYTANSTLRRWSSIDSTLLIKGTLGPRESLQCAKSEICKEITTILKNDDGCPGLATISRDSDSRENFVRSCDETVCEVGRVGGFTP